MTPTPSLPESPPTYRDGLGPGVYRGGRGTDYGSGPYGIRPGWTCRSQSTPSTTPGRGGPVGSTTARRRRSRTGVGVLGPLPEEPRPHLLHPWSAPRLPEGQGRRLPPLRHVAVLREHRDGGRLVCRRRPSRTRDAPSRRGGRGWARQSLGRRDPV